MKMTKVKRYLPSDSALLIIDTVVQEMWPKSIKNLPNGTCKHLAPVFLKFF